MTRNHHEFIISDDLKIYFEQAGSGPPLILVHGWGSDTKGNWVDTGWVERLQEIRRVISIDIRGHGRSDKPHATDPYSYAAMCNDVLGVMDYLEVERADLMGYSMGSFMGAYLLGNHSNRFTSMILGGIGNETESSVGQRTVIADALRASDPSTLDRAGQGFRKFVESNPNNDLEALASSALKMWPEGYPLQLAGPGIVNAKFPVLVVNGEEDHPYVESADQFTDALPFGKHVRIPGTDHLSTVADERFKTVAIEFLLSH